MIAKAKSTRGIIHLVPGNAFRIRGTQAPALCGATPGNGGWTTSWITHAGGCTECQRIHQGLRNTQSTTKEHK